MIPVLLVFILLAWFIVAHYKYGRRIERKLIGPSDTNETPAHTCRDDVDFCPTNRFVLFGHHFSSIAGAGPILGPVAAVALFGWAPVVAWIAFGVVFIGAVHDYLTLMISVRSRGASIAEVTEQCVGRRGRLLFSAFVWAALVLIIAVFASAAAKTFVSAPAVVIPSLGMIPLAIVLGVAVNRRVLPLWAGTLGALLFIGGFIWLGKIYPVDIGQVIPGISGNHIHHVWSVFLLVYGLVASALPVWLLLQPRDYLCTWLLLLGMAIGYTGFFLSPPPLKAPAFISSEGWSQGPLWPMLFVIVACGAISGFHSLVASGTSSKQLSSETEGLAVGFGSTLTEGALALLAVLAVAAGLYWDTPPPGKEGLGFLANLKISPITAFGKGFGVLVSPMVKQAAGTAFGIILINTFVMTTLDTAVRLGRFVTAELFGPVVKAARNRWVGSLIVTVPAGYLAVTGRFSIIWPVFGAANQLIAALALIVITAYLAAHRKPVLYTLLPALFMLVTTIGALGYQGWYFMFPTPGKDSNYLLAAVALGLMVLSLEVARETFVKLRRIRQNR